VGAPVLTAAPSRDPTVVNASATTQTGVPRDGAHHLASLRTLVEESFAGHTINLPVGPGSSRADFTQGREGLGAIGPRQRGSLGAARRSSTALSRCRAVAHPTDH